MCVIVTLNLRARSSLPILLCAGWGAQKYALKVLRAPSLRMYYMILKLFDCLQGGLEGVFNRYSYDSRPL